MTREDLTHKKKEREKVGKSIKESIKERKYSEKLIKRSRKSKASRAAQIVKRLRDGQAGQTNRPSN